MNCLVTIKIYRDDLMVSPEYRQSITAVLNGFIALMTFQERHKCSVMAIYTIFQNRLKFEPKKTILTPSLFIEVPVPNR